jgi:periplasmic protein CpxP/Spy
MKKLSLVAALALGGLVACSTVAFAQDAKDGKDAKKGGRMTVEQRMERLSTELSLTDDQKPKVKALLEETAKKMGELRDLPQDERRPKFQALREEETKKMKEILKPEQFEKYQTINQRRPGGPSGDKKAEKKAE